MIPQKIALKILLVCVLAPQLLRSQSLISNDSQSPPVRRVLILNEVGTAWPGINLIDQGIRAALDTSPYNLEVYREYMETILFPDPADQQRFREFYVRKYQNRRPDVIITVGPSPLKFMADTHKTVFPGVPIVYCYPNWIAGKPSLDDDFTGVENDLAAVETIETALRLKPATRHIIVLTGVSANDISFANLAKEQLQRFEGKLDITYLTNLTMPDLLERVKHVADDSIILYTSITLDAAGRRFTSEQSSAMVAAVATAPVFSLSDSTVGHGEVGGKVFSRREQGRLAGALVLRVLKGEKPQDIPRMKAGTVFMFDWRVLKRWGMKESNLPPGSIVLNREVTPWEQYRSYFILGAILIVLQAVLIAGLLWQRTRRRRSEEALADLSGRLIAAHEEERSRIAREVHDDYQQRLALVANDLDVLRESPQVLPIDQKLQHLWSEVSELASDMHSFSHRLHSSTLETLGLPLGIKSFCEEFAQQQGMEISFTSEKVPRSIPPDVALCLFRVVQEALRNVKRHSGADGAEVMLQYTGSKLHLRVTDQGRGFDPKSTSADAGIGIRSMEERLRLVGGKLDLSSQPLQGTTLEAWVPLRIATQVAG